MAKKVFVGLSGGVDSAASAALLKQQGYDVTGVFIKIWQPEFIECTWKEDWLDAMRVCAALSIPFREIDLSEEYKRGVVDSMLADYAAGITPNPDILCNARIKFGAFLRWAREHGAEKIATGHYARIVEQDGRFRLLRGADSNKDQSYFLFRLTQETLAHALFPVGDLMKPEVREKAKKFNLPVAQKHDSQGICSSNRLDAFVSEVHLRDVSWVDTAPQDSAYIEVQARYRDKPVAATLTTNGNGTRVHFAEPHSAPPGQSLVIYKGDVCIGGGVIEKQVTIR